ncbi:ParB-like protein, partial [Vibrio campbellii]
MLKALTYALTASTLFVLPNALANDIAQGDVIEVELNQVIPTQPSVGYDQVYYKLGRFAHDKKKLFDEIC